jgi:hypothetical protein
MNRARVLIIVGSFSAIALSAIIYIEHAVEDSMTRPADDTAPSTLVSAEVVNTDVVANPDTSLQKDTTDEQTAALRAELKRLNEKFDALRQEVQLRLAVQPAAGNEERSEETALGDLRTDPRALAEAERREEARIQSLENDFQNESMGDLEWSSRASAALEQAFASDRAANAQVNDLECRSRQCRVELTYRTNADMDRLMSWLPQQISETLPSIAAHQVEQADGSTTMVLYLFGDGYEPPPNGG